MLYTTLKDTNKDFAMDKSIIEGNAVGYVKFALRATGIIDPYINEGDKTPSWDGELFVYNSEDFNKNNLKFVIPVQVKGRSFAKYRNTFQVEISDLLNYKKKQNVILRLLICFMKRTIQMLILSICVKQLKESKHSPNKR